MSLWASVFQRLEIQALIVTVYSVYTNYALFNNDFNLILQETKEKDPSKHPQSPRSILETAFASAPESTTATSTK